MIHLPNARHLKAHRSPTTPRFLAVLAAALLLFTACASDPGDIGLENDDTGDNQTDSDIGNQTQNDADNQNDTQINNPSEDTDIPDAPHPDPDPPDADPPDADPIEPDPDYSCDDHGYTINAGTNSTAPEFTMLFDEIKPDGLNAAIFDSGSIFSFDYELRIQPIDKPDTCRAKVEGATCESGDERIFHICGGLFDPGEYCVFLFDDQRPEESGQARAVTTFAVDEGADESPMCRELPCWPDDDAGTVSPDLEAEYCQGLCRLC